MKRITISPQARRLLEERWPRSTVSDALNFKRNSPLAEEIRAEAISHFGGFEENC